MKKETKVDFNDPIFTVKEASILLKTDESTVRNLINKGLLKALKLGRLKITKEEIVRFLRFAEGKDFTDLDNVLSLGIEENKFIGGQVNRN